MVLYRIAYLSIWNIFHLLYPYNSPPRPEQFWGPPSLLYILYQGSSPGG